MRRTVPAIVGGALILLGWVSTTLAGSPEACVQAVQLDGEAALEASLRGALEARGSIGEDVEGCGLLSVWVEPRGNHIALRILDRYGRLFEREVGSEAMAVVLIESFRRVEVNAPLTSPFLQSDPLSGKDIEMLRIPQPSEPTQNAGAWLAAETVITDEGATWFGGAAAGCVDFGSMCVGGTLFVSKDSGITANAQYDDLSRFSVGLLFGVDRPFNAGRLSLIPGIAAGLGWVSTTRTNSDGNVTLDGGGVRASAHFLVTRPLTPSLSLAVNLSMDASPFGRTQAVMEEGYLIPGEPALAFRLGVGLAFGAP